METFRKGAAALALLSMISGCAFHQPAAKMAMDYNRFVAEATNRQTVLNILRARDREPLHFTSFSKIDGSISLDTTGTFGGTGVERVPGTNGAGFITDKRTIAAPSLSVEVTSGTDFEMAINATDDFWKGILSPVQPSMVAYYLQQGWPPDLLSYLFVDNIDFALEVRHKGLHGAIVRLQDKSPATVHILTVTNSPAPRAPRKSASGVSNLLQASASQVGADQPDPGMTGFEALIRCRSVVVDSEAEPEKYVKVGKISDMANVAPDALAKLRTKTPDKDPNAPPPLIDPDDTPPLRYQQSDAAQSVSLTLGARSGQCVAWNDIIETAIHKAVPATLGVSDAALKKSRPKGDAYKQGDIARRPREGLDASSRTVLKGEGLCDRFVDTSKYTCNLTVTVTLRSIEGVIYYLGELQRTDVQAPLLVDNDCTLTKDTNPASDPCYSIPILKLEKEPLPEGTDTIAQVEYKGDVYALRSSGEKIGTAGGRGSEVLTLVEQLLNLYRSSKDFPSTPYVRLSH